MAAVSKIEHDVVELRTDVGCLYVRPTGWQRLYLRWTFRNFHNLSQQILNRRQRELIEKLSRSAIFTPTERVPASAIIGVVENVKVLPLPSTAEIPEMRPAAAPAAEARLAVLQSRAEEAVLEEGAPAARPAVRQAADVPPAVHRADADFPPEKVEEAAMPAPLLKDGEGRRGVRIKSWAAASALAAAAALLALGLWLAPLRTIQPPRIALAPAAPAIAAAPPLKPAAPGTRGPAAGRTAPAVQTLNAAEARAIAGQHATKKAAASTSPAAPVPDSEVLPQIAEAPRSGFIYPVAPRPDLVGKVVLKAVVGGDGSVKQVEVLSGNRALAAAAVRAVREWRYSPPQVNGRTVEAETHVTISFLGDDAVSIILPPNAQ